MIPKLKWILLAAAVLLGIVIFWPRPSGESSIAEAASSYSPRDTSVQAKPVDVSSSEPVRPDVFAPVPGTVANAATNNTAGSFIPVVEASRPEELKPAPYERAPKAKLIDWEILPPDPARPNVLTRARLIDVTGGIAAAASSPSEATRLAAERGVKYPFLRVEEELTLDAQDRVVAERVTREMIADEIIVKFPKGTPSTAAATFAEQLGGVAAARPFAEDTWLMAVPVALRAVPEALESSAAATPYAEYVEPNFVLRPAATPNDTKYSDSWHWSRIDAPSAWNRRTSADGVIVAVIDSGVRFTHEDLAGNMWVNPGETAGNGIDDDANGYVDDVYGMDELDNDGNPSDGTGHGTHCAGLIGAVGNNSKGVTGAAWSGVDIMGLRFIQEFGSVSDNVRCIDYAIAKGADIINASYGSTTFVTSEAAAIYRAQQAGIVMVAAAGNNNSNNDTTPFYPASYTQYTSGGRTYTISNIISVGATTSSPGSEGRASFSNYGATSVDIFAPGVDIWSTRALNDTDYNYGSGTSYAAPIVSGVLALRKAGRPDDSVAQLISGVLNGADALGSLSGLAVTGGRLNANNVVYDAPAVLATAWHRPAHREALISSNTMRSPAYEVGIGSPFTVYSGVRRANNSYGTANQTGGTIFYRAGTNGAWSSNALAFHSNNGDYQFWSNSVPGTATTNIVQYYLKLTFDSGVAGTNYLYGNDNSSWVTTDEAAAQSQPFSLRDRPSWVYHGNNRSVNGNNVTFTTLVGYAGSDASNNLVFQGANFGALYYTTNGATPVGSQGNAGNADTFVVFFTYQGLQQDNSAAGEAMIWTALVTNMPTFQNINYRIGFWNSANGEEQWAGYNTTNTNPVTVFTIGTVGAPQLTVSTPSNGSLNADYTTTKLYVDEIAGDSIPVSVTFAPNTSNITDVELYSNLNQRDLANADANGDLIPDGIKPPSGNTVSVTNTNTYFRAYTMTNAGGGNYTATINATKTGSYRLTARYRTTGNTNWTYYSSDDGSPDGSGSRGSFNGRRDHAITVAPIQARDIRMYELNIFNIEASGKSFATRSTIEDLTDEPNAIHTSSNRVNKFNLGYLQDLGVNWIWFQPYHPYGWEGRHESAANIRARDAAQNTANTKVWDGSSGYYDDVNYPYELGSPYAKKNFWEVEPRMSAAFSGSPTVQTNVSSSANRATAMAAFQNFMAKADAAGINLMPDAAFNHSAWDVELGQAGVDYIMSGAGASGWSASDLIHDREVRVFSRKNDYAQRATYYNNFFDNSIAPAPDRGDFGKWLDVVDIFFGRYAALVSQNPSDNNNRLNEADTFNYSSSDGNFDGITRGVWRYFARYAPYWLEKGRPAGEARNSTPADGDAAARYAWDARGIDGLRCDFGQGLPPQAWEYIINVARSYKWSFVFMSESLDGGAITYRSNRHFDILNENIVFPGKAASSTSNYREMFEARRGAYGQGLVLLNTVSHDEDNYQDPWQAFIRYAVYGTLDGAPMVFPGQELGISNLYGYDLYEINFGKPVPHFKTYNSMMIAWGNDDYALNQLQPAYSAINAARGFSRALRSNNRYFLDRTSGGVHESIFSVAKYETLNGSPASNDVVFGFVNLNRDAGQSGTFNVAQDVDNNGVNDYGIKAGRTYNVRNIAAHLGQSAGRRDTLLWGAGLTGENILSNGIYVGMNAIPGSSSGAWAAAPYEAKYLKLYDTTAPGAVVGPVTNNLANGSYAITNQATFTWAAVAADSEGIVPIYKVSVSTNGVLATNAIVTSNSYTYIAPNADTKVDVTVQAVNPNDTNSASAATVVNTSYLLTAGGDYNTNGINNATDVGNGIDPTVTPTPGVATAVVIEPAATPAAGSALSIAVKAVDSQGNTDANYTGPVTLTISGPNGYSQSLSANAVAGVATFSNVILPEGGSYTLGASSGSLTAQSGTAYTVKDGATYLPAGDGVWNASTNWDNGVVPNGTTARAIIPGNASANRTVTNNSSITLAALTFSNGSSAFANTISGTAGNSLAFQATNANAVMTVTGSGTGYAELNLAGPVVLNSDLVVDVQSTNSTNQEYGAMRLSGTNWSGAGGVIKRGPGMAGFTQAGTGISGNILVEQGVLAFSEPSISSLLSTNITVQSGGQLRLSSSFTTTNVPRTNNIKGVLNLAGSGRSGVGTNENLGVLGALRLESGTTGTTSLLTNVVNLTASADIHAPAGNTIQLDGPLTASSNNVVLTKSGGGTLTLSTNSSSFTGGLTVNRGTLHLSNPVMTNTTNSLVLAADTVLTGNGRWGGALQASGGASLAFGLGSSPAGSAPLRVGSVTLTGSNNVALTVANDTSPGSYPLLTVDGSFSGTNNITLAAAPQNYPTASLSFSNGTLYAVLPAGVAATSLALEVGSNGAGLTLPDITIRAVNAVNLVDTAFNGTVILTITGPDNYSQTYEHAATAGVVVFTGIAVPAGGSYTMSAGSGSLSTASGTPVQAAPPEQDPREVWNAFYSLTGANALESADPDNDGISNIFERAMRLNPTVADPGLPVIRGGLVNGVLTVTYRVAKNQSDLTVSLLRWSGGSWATLAPTASDTSHPDYTVYTVTLNTDPEIGILRVRITR